MDHELSDDEMTFGSGAVDPGFDDEDENDPSKTAVTRDQLAWEDADVSCRYEPDVDRYIAQYGNIFGHGDSVRTALLDLCEGLRRREL